MTSSRHLNGSTLAAAARGEGDIDSLHAIHLETCAKCRREVAVRRSLAATTTSDGCPDLEQLVALVEGALGAVRGTALRRHAQNCADCTLALEDLGHGQATVERVLGPGTPDQLSALWRRLRALVRFEMPPMLVMQTRAGAAPAPHYERAAAAYRRGDYEVACASFEASRDGREKATARPFFHGVCLLQLGRDRAAAEELTQAVSRPPVPGEYHWFQAQALLRLGDAERALQALDRAARRPGPFRGEAKQQALEVRQSVAVIAARE